MQRSLTATLKYALMSYKKLNLVSKMVRGMRVSEAQKFLRFLPKKAAKTLSDLINSASANATHNLGLDMSDLFIETIDVGRGPKMKRVRAVGRGRMHKYERHRAFLRVTLGVK